MTYEEAKEAIVNPQTVLMVASVRYGKRHAQEVCQKVLEALDKQIAKKPSNEEYEDGTFAYVCPSCYTEVLEKQPYCDDCGQALDWGE